ncbi:hypothetical protein BJ508DRAFT_305771 [Ascobolus immersus RN42]|uniref:Uncharacterized protein n=1 Tax=Ascobolus immersus RN42 TaxID=1160509 RepID=A0A3N4IE09_ASCIM|nr:hypothetical protein BJ508DRAFT_305771 [Ascobolus immersus RN42]
MDFGYTYSATTVVTPATPTTTTLRVHNTTSGPLSDLSTPLQDLPTATLLANTTLRPQWSTPSRAAALESVLSALSTPLTTASAFSASAYRNRRRHALGDGLQAFGKLAETNEYGPVTLPAASTALTGSDAHLGLRALTTALLTFFTTATTTSLLSTILPQTLTPLQAPTYSGPVLAALRRYVTEVEAEETIDPFRKQLLDSTSAAARKLLKSEFVGFNELQGGTEEFANVAGLLLWLLAPRNSRSKQVYPTSSLTTWALSVALSSLGFEVNPQYDLIDTQSLYDTTFTSRFEPQKPQVFHVIGEWGQTDPLRPQTKKAWCKPHTVFTSVRELPQHIFRNEAAPYTHELLSILFEDVFSYVRHTIEDGVRMPVREEDLGKADRRLQTLIERSAGFVQGFYTMSRRRASYVDVVLTVLGVIRDLSLAWLDWIESTDKRSKRHSTGSTLYKRKALVVGAALDAYELAGVQDTQFQGLGFSPFDIAETAIFGAAYGLLSTSINWNNGGRPKTEDLEVAFWHRGWGAHYNLTNYVGEPPERDGIRACAFGLDIFDTLDWLLQRRVICQLTERLRRVENNGMMSPGPGGRASPEARFGSPLERDQREFKLIHAMLTGTQYALEPNTPPPAAIYTAGITLLKPHIVNPTMKFTQQPYAVFTALPLDLPVSADGTIPISPPQQSLNRPFTIPLNNHIRNEPITIKPTDTPLDLTFAPDWDAEGAGAGMDDPSASAGSTPPIVARLTSTSNNVGQLPNLALQHLLHPHFRQLWTNVPSHSTSIPCQCGNPQKTSSAPRLWRELQVSELLSFKSLHMQLRANVGRPFWLVVQTGGCEVSRMLTVLATARVLFEWRKMRGPGYKGFGQPPGGPGGPNGMGGGGPNGMNGGPPGGPGGPMGGLEDLVFVECWRCFEQRAGGVGQSGGMKIIVAV